MNTQQITAITAVIAAVRAIMSDDDDDDIDSILGKRGRYDDDEDDDDDQNNSNNNNNNNQDELYPPPPQKKQRIQSPILLLDNTNNNNNNNNNDNSKPNYNKPISLNVGGITYMTSIQTLTGYESMLKARFSSKYQMRACFSNGSYFIDRNGNLFKYILEYLRNGQLILPLNWNKTDIWTFYNEIKYFSINSLFEPVLLKLFNSKIIQNPVIKLKLFDKIMSVLNINLESLYEWNLIYEYSYKNMKLSIKIDGEDQTRLLYNTNIECRNTGTSLLLAQSFGSIFGIFLQIQNHMFVFDKSFGFNCGDNSFHITQNINKNKLKFKYYPVRKATDAEAKIDEEVYSSFMHNLYPFTFKTTNNGYINHGSFSIKDHAQTLISYSTTVSKLEVWSIPQNYN